MWRWKPTTRIAVAIALCAAMAACLAPQGERPARETQANPAFRVDSRLREDEARFRVEPASSRALILVRRDGPLARFGHDHALVARPASGFVIWSEQNPADGRAAFTIDVASLDVDPADARADLELDTTPAEDAIEATRTNLLSYVLQADSWPHVEVGVRFLDGSLPDIRARASLVINGIPGIVDVPVKVHVSGDALSASGAFKISQKAWGIEPFAVLGGGLRVADVVEIRFELAAQREPEAPGQKPRD
jgi:polyisoprenoid-binding protein YceI